MAQIIRQIDKSLPPSICKLDRHKKQLRILLLLVCLPCLCCCWLSSFYGLCCLAISHQLFNILHFIMTDREGEMRTVCWVYLKSSILLPWFYPLMYCGVPFSTAFLPYLFPSLSVSVCFSFSYNYAQFYYILFFILRRFLILIKRKKLELIAMLKIG